MKEQLKREVEHNVTRNALTEAIQDLERSKWELKLEKQGYDDDQINFEAFKENCKWIFKACEDNLEEFRLRATELTKESENLDGWL